MIIYILKINGTNKIPDFVQIRDDVMTLKAYFRLSQAEKGLLQNNLKKESKQILSLLEIIPFGKIYKYETTN